MVSHYFHAVLNAVLKLHQILILEPDPVADDCTTNRWKFFKDCLGALDGTYINMLVRQVDKARYRTRKGEVAVNVLGVCDRDMKFTYVLTGWEGSAADARV
ncbi:UNVERIFIED_CONTAM: hypothetical protein Sradi_5717100 [Sesamum radiatum]|uniref:DDE Tnp4 domain-containing protein n=1 Tax=Sesamum radiatum TaxID=300843 RepID=A0AAW2L586_SESRA